MNCSRPAATRVAVAAGLALALLPRAALAHTGPPPAPSQAWMAWTWDPWVLGALLLLAWGYSVGVRQLWARAGVGRGVSTARVWAFGGGLLALFVALISPLDALGSALFSAHMAQHLVLTLIAAPLLALGAPNLVLLWALPRRWRGPIGHRWHRARLPRAGWRWLTRIPVATALALVGLWAWHAPALYQATLRSAPLHALEHTAFLATAFVYWWALLHRRRGAAGYAPAVLSLAVMALLGALLGALLTLSGTVWYPAYAARSAPYGLSALDDQQLAGAIMWVPTGVEYIVVGSVMFVAWLEAVARDDERRDARARAVLP